jgi:hypothetical protein
MGEWSEVGPLIPPAKRGGNKRSVDISQVLAPIVLEGRRIHCRFSTEKRRPD